MIHHFSLCIPEVHKSIVLSLIFLPYCIWSTSVKHFEKGQNDTSLNHGGEIQSLIKETCQVLPNTLLFITQNRRSTPSEDLSVRAQKSEVDSSWIHAVFKITDFSLNSAPRQLSPDYTSFTDNQLIFFFTWFHSCETTQVNKEVWYMLGPRFSTIPLICLQYSETLQDVIVVDGDLWLTISLKAVFLEALFIILIIIKAEWDCTITFKWPFYFTTQREHTWQHLLCIQVSNKSYNKLCDFSSCVKQRRINTVCEEQIFLIKTH